MGLDQNLQSIPNFDNIVHDVESIWTARKQDDGCFFFIILNFLIQSSGNMIIQ